MSNIGKYRLTCQSCEATHYSTTSKQVCSTCEKKRQQAEESFQKRYARILLENPDYFKDAEEFAQEMLKLSKISQ